MSTTFNTTGATAPGGPTNLGTPIDADPTKRLSWLVTGGKFTPDENEAINKAWSIMAKAGGTTSGIDNAADRAQVDDVTRMINDRLDGGTQRSAELALGFQ